MRSRRMERMTRTVQAQLRSSIGLPFQDFFTEERVGAILDDLGIPFRKRIFSPLVTLLTFIGQVMVDKCCRSAVSRVATTMASTGKITPSTATGAYCQSRSRLPERFFERTLEETAGVLDGELPAEKLWLGRHRVFAIDGSSAQTPDTAANRKRWGLPSGVKPGCGFPIVPFVGFFSLLTGAVVRLVIGKLGTHERRMFRMGSRFLRPGDVCVGDRGFCSYADIAQQLRRGVQTVFRLFNRESDFRRGNKLGSDDHVITWSKPKIRPRGMSKREFQRLPDELSVREIRVNVDIKGFRSKEVILITTLLDPEVYPKWEIAALYLRRWDIEVDFRHIKTTLGMEMLSTEKPEMIHKEIMTYMIAYNMIRVLMWRAGISAGEDPLRLSFKGSLQYLEHMAPHLGRAPSDEEHARLVGVLYEFIARTRLPDRPNRVEPRVRKRRPKSYPLMTQPRKELKQELING